MAGYAITDAIFSPVARKIPEQEKNHKFAFVDLDRAFDQVPCAVLWWAM